MPTEEPSPRGSLIPLLFWLCLLASVGTYATCTLAPRLVLWEDLRREYDANQTALVASQQRVKHMQRIVDALDHDPEFAARLARTELDAATPGAEVIAVAPGLDYDPRAVPAVVRAVAAPEPWYLPALRRIQDDGILRTRLLLVAAGLFLFAFFFFNDATVRVVRKLCGWRSVACFVFARYLQAPDEDEVVAAARAARRSKPRG